MRRKSGDWTRTCKVGKHPAPIGDLRTYRDQDRGITNDVEICQVCLFKHVHEHYPGSPLELHLLDLYPELQPPAPASGA